MKVFIPLFYLASLALAEPPVGDGYPAARSSSDHDIDHYHDNQHEHHSSEHQRSSSQEHGPSLGDDYDSPNARTALNPRGRSFAPPTVRVSFNQRFGSASSRSSAQGHSTPGTRSHSQDAARNGISQGYPAARLSQEYGTPSDSSARTLSTEYGVPNARSTPSEEYGVPAVSRSNQNHQSHASASSRAFSQDHSSPAARSQIQSESPSHAYTAPSLRSNQISQGYESPKSFGRSAANSRSSPSSTYGAPSSRSLSPTYGAPSARNSNRHSLDSVSNSYGTPSQRDASETYSAPSERGLSQEYGLPSSGANLKTEAVASSYSPSNARSAPSSSYLPASRNAMPSEQYGVPEKSNQDYEDAKTRALNELLNQEPANYDFAYQIEDQESGSDFGHTETREDNRAEGSYFVVLPDGTKQTVEYEADERGYKPRISVEPAAGGYDDNAQNVGRSAEGPY